VVLIHLVAGAMIEIAVDVEGHGDAGEIACAHDPHGRGGGHLGSWSLLAGWQQQAAGVPAVVRG